MTPSMNRARFKSFARRPRSRSRTCSRSCSRVSITCRSRHSTRTPGARGTAGVLSARLVALRRMGHAPVVPARDVVRSHSVDRGESMLRPGEVSKALFFIYDGEVEIRTGEITSADDGHRSQPTTTLSATSGEYFGESGLLSMLASGSRRCAAERVVVSSFAGATLLVLRPASTGSSPTFAIIQKNRDIRSMWREGGASAWGAEIRTRMLALRRARATRSPPVLQRGGDRLRYHRSTVPRHRRLRWPTLTMRSTRP